MVAVFLKNVVKKFGDFTAVDHISLEVSAGEIFGFLGPNGAGKSTTIRMLCGLRKPTSGEGRVHGLDIVTQAEEIKSNLGYMSQRFSLYDDLKVEENMRFFGGIYGLNAKACEMRMEKVLQIVGLSDRRHSLTGRLPGGLKQRLALGCAILHSPPIIFLDELSSGLDPVPRRNFWALTYNPADDGGHISPPLPAMRDRRLPGWAGSAPSSRDQDPRSRGLFPPLTGLFHSSG